MPGYFGKQRWDYFRLTNLSHNTLVIDGKLQATPHTGCPIKEGEVDAVFREADIDLTAAYAGQAEKVIRAAIWNPQTGKVLISDQIEKPVGPIRWAVVTKAKPKIEGGRMILEQSGKRLVMIRTDRLGGEWEEFSLKPPTEREQQNEGFHLIGFTVTPASDKVSIGVAWELE
jgi:hypothetical protein